MMCHRWVWLGGLLLLLAAGCKPIAEKAEAPQAAAPAEKPAPEPVEPPATEAPPAEPGAAESEAGNQEGDAAAPAFNEDTGEEELSPRLKQVQGRETFRRYFSVRAEGFQVGRGMLTLMEFHEGAVIRSGMEYHLFPTGGTLDRSYLWFKGFTSEYTARPVAIAEWANGREGPLGMNYRLQGGKDGVKLSGNLFDVGHRNPRMIAVPDGYRLAAAFRRQVQEAITDPGDEVSFTWKRYDWRSWEPRWYTLTYRRVGPADVRSATGQVHTGFEFEVTADDPGYPAETVWFDAGGLLLRRVVPSLSNLELLVTEEELADTGEYVPWDDAASAIGPKAGEIGKAMYVP